MTFIAVLDYGIGNLRSAQKALECSGADARLVTSADQANGAAGVVLPGVGAFGSCMNALRRSGLDEVVYSAVRAQTPFLGVCVGLQMLYERSEESPGIDGLGVFPGTISRMKTDEKLPQMQWNRIQPLTKSPLLAGLGTDPWFYFVHSYSAPISEDVLATCDYGGDFVAVVQRERTWATQFHPEKSSAAGLRLLANFVAEVS